MREQAIEAMARAIFNTTFEGEFDRADSNWQEHARRQARAALDALLTILPIGKRTLDHLAFLTAALSTLADKGADHDAG